MPGIDLFAAGHIGELSTPNRILMAPMTRNRATFEGVPTELAIEYYAQRATAGLITTEGTAPSAVGSGYVRTPAIVNAEQIAGWRRITDAVHAKGGRMFLQLMHVGRIANVANRVLKDPPVAPSAIRAAGQIFTDAGLQEFSIPRALETSEIPGVIAEYAQATRNGLEAGFDGVELHGASGYLPMQFLSTGSNRRTDGYGGSLHNRLRFVIETLQAMIDAAGSSARIGLKISPAMPFNDIQDDDPVETYSALVKAISPLKLAILHVLRSAPLPNIFEILRPLYQGTFAAGGGFGLDSGNAALASGTADFVVFGKPFISNPDLPQRLRTGAALAPWDVATFYSGGARGYIDYPPLAGTRPASDDR
jgi:N-ethylmaleimide reductase